MIVTFYCSENIDHIHCLRNFEQNLYLIERRESQRRSVSRVIKNLFDRTVRGPSLDEIKYEVEIELGRQIEKRHIQTVLGNIGASCDPIVGTWSMIKRPN